MNVRLDELLKQAGWKKRGAGWTARGRVYRAVEEEAPGSWDRSLAPYLAKAILRARVGPSDAEPVAVLSVRRASALADERLSRFVAEVAPGQSWILLDGEGRVFPHVTSAPELIAVAARQPVSGPPAAVGTRPPALFTDLSQWMLKVLLAPLLPAGYLAVPRDRSPRNATTLADVARVSLPAAVRFLHALEAEGQLDTRFGDLRVPRPLELLRQWRDRMRHPARVEVAAAAVHGSFRLEMLLTESRGFARAKGLEAQPIVLGLHAACEKLGLGHVSGTFPVVWTPSLEGRALESLGLVAVGPEQKVDVVLRVPRYPESVFRGAVEADGFPVTDVIQCWLDSSHYRIRGQEQADFLWRRVFKPAFDDGSAH